MTIFMTLLGIAVLVAVDQMVKFWTVSVLKDIGTIPLIPNVFQLTYVENRGAAFSILQNQQWLFIIIALVFLVVIAVALRRNYVQTMLGKFALLLICSGAIGNVLDRIFRHFVVDMLYFSLIDFPVFNVADIYVCVGVALFFYYMLFQHKDKEESSEEEKQA
ncbi:MAG: signal peptidase II [Butyricicoccus sp.]